MAHSPQTFDRLARANKGDYIRVAVPPQLAEYLGVEQGDKLRFQKEEGEHGKYASFWKVEETPTEEQESSAEDGSQV